MRDVFNTKKTPLTTMQQLRTKFPRFYDELTEKFPGLEHDPQRRNTDFEQIDFNEAYDMGNGQAIVIINRDPGDAESPPFDGVPLVWLGDEMIDLYDCLDQNYEPSEAVIDACSLATEAFGDGWWNEMTEPGWGKKTKARMDKLDARIASVPVGSGASWEDLLGPEEEEPIQAPLNPKKSFRN